MPELSKDPEALSVSERLRSDWIRFKSASGGTKMILSLLMIAAYSILLRPFVAVLPSGASLLNWIIILFMIPVAILVTIRIALISGIFSLPSYYDAVIVKNLDDPIEENDSWKEAVSSVDTQDAAQAIELCKKPSELNRSSLQTVINIIACGVCRRGTDVESASWLIDPEAGQEVIGWVSVDESPDPEATYSGQGSSLYVSKKESKIVDRVFRVYDSIINKSGFWRPDLGYYFGPAVSGLIALCAFVQYSSQQNLYVNPISEGLNSDDEAARYWTLQVLSTVNPFALCDTDVISREIEILNDDDEERKTREQAIKSLSAQARAPPLDKARNALEEFVNKSPAYVPSSLQEEAKQQMRKYDIIENDIDTDVTDNRDVAESPTDYITPISEIENQSNPEE